MRTSNPALNDDVFRNAAGEYGQSRHCLGILRVRERFGPGLCGAKRSVKMPVDVLDTARVVAALRNETITDVLSDILRPALAKLEREELAKRSKRAEGGKDSK